MKLVLKTSYGSGNISVKAKEMLEELKGESCTVNGTYHWNEEDIYPTVDRFDKDWIKVVETLGREAGGDTHTRFEIKEINEPFKIEEYDSSEYIVTLSEFKNGLIYPKD